MAFKKKKKPQFFNFQGKIRINKENKTFHNFMTVRAKVVIRKFKSGASIAS
jgi:hypothetical protein